jgi:hypothetical protein
MHRGNSQLYSIHPQSARSQQSRPALAGRDRLDWETQDASAALSARDVAGGDLVVE